MLAQLEHRQKLDATMSLRNCARDIGHLEKKNDSIYLISGYSDITTRILNTTSNTWTEGPSFKEKRRGYSCFYDKLSNTVYVIGGMQSWPEKFLQTTLKLNLEKNIWETVHLPRWYGFQC